MLGSRPVSDGCEWTLRLPAVPPGENTLILPAGFKAGPRGHPVTLAETATVNQVLDVAQAARTGGGRRQFAGRRLLGDRARSQPRAARARRPARFTKRERDHRCDPRHAHHPLRSGRRQRRTRRRLVWIRHERIVPSNARGHLDRTPRPERLFVRLRIVRARVGQPRCARPGVAVSGGRRPARHEVRGQQAFRIGLCGRRASRLASVQHRRGPDCSGPAGPERRRGQGGQPAMGRPDANVDAGGAIRPIGCGGTSRPATRRCPCGRSGSRSCPRGRTSSTSAGRPPRA